MSFYLIIPLLLIFVGICGLGVLLKKSFKSSGNPFPLLEIIRAFVILSTVHVPASFILSYNDVSFFKQYHFAYLLLIATLIFLITLLPVGNLPSTYNKNDRILLAMLGSLFSVVISEFTFFSVYSSPFSAWIAYYAWALIIAVFFGMLSIYNHCFPKKKIIFFIP